MPKKRVYELAKQLNIGTKDILEKLKEWEPGVKNHMSSVDTKLEEKLIEAFKPKEAPEKKEPVKPAEVKRNRDNRVQPQSGARPNAGRDQRSQTDRPPGERPQRPQGERPQRPQGQRPQYDRPQGERPQGQRPQYDRPHGDRPQGDRPQGQRPQYDRPQGDRPQGDRPPQRTGAPNQRGNYSGNYNQGNYNQRNTSGSPGTQQRDGNFPRRTDRPYNPAAPRDNRNQNTAAKKPNYSGTPYRPPRDGANPQNRDNRPPRDGQQPRFNNYNRDPNRPPRPNTGNRPPGTFGQRRDIPIPSAPNTSGTDANKERKKDKSYKYAGPAVNKDKKRDRKDEPDKKRQGGLNKNDRRKPARGHKQPEKPPEPQISLITIPSRITVKEFAQKISKTAPVVIKILMKKGVMVSLNQEIEFETASSVAEEFGILAEAEAEENVEDIMKKAFIEEADKEEDLQTRPPVVVVMGHVDHGKTSILDAVRQSKVAENEAGGITQHIGAYTVSVSGKQITFLDTPGHEAFTAMRMRGAQITDIAVLVVAADDGVMPQTVEAINHAKAAGVDIIVAINKIDKEGANPDRVKQELTEYSLIAEDWGGDTICVPVSALKKTGIDNLLEMIILVSEMKELKANPNKSARGAVIEALLDKGRGPAATVLVQEGTLNVGDSLVAGATFGKVRAMIDDKGKKIKKASPSTPVEILGLSEVPRAGDLFFVAGNEKHARHVAESVVKKGRIDMTRDARPAKVSLADLFTRIKAGEVKDLNVVVKADVQGSVEAVRQSLEKLTTEEVRVRAIHGGVGAITESDVYLASASNAIIIGFNVRPEQSAKKIAEDESVDIRLYRVIYSAIDDIKDAMKGLLDPVYQEKVAGHAEIRQLYKASSIGTIAGSYVTDGKIKRNSKVRVLRDNIVVYEGELATLKRFKDDVKEVNSGYDCGILLSKFNDIKEGDVIEAFEMEEIPR